VYATGAAKATGINRYLNVGADYNLSKRTTAYVRAGRVTDRNGGFNGRPIAVSPSGRDGVAVPANGAVDGLALGLRHAF
jgi:predicted porin